MANHLRNISLREYLRFLKYMDCKLVRTTGGHSQFSHPKAKRPLTLQTHIDPVSEMAIKNHLKELGISKAEFLEIFNRL